MGNIEYTVFIEYEREIKMNKFTLAANRFRGVHMVQRPIHETKIISFTEFCKNLKNGFTGEMFANATFKQIAKLEKQYTIPTYL